MRYIGSKQQVLSFIKQTIFNTYGDCSDAIVGDLFAGTACVGEMLKKSGARIISNDYMNFSYMLQIERIKLNKEPESALPYNALIKELNEIDGIEGFFYKEYTVEGTMNGEYVRNYFSSDNAKKIDAMRTKINSWIEQGTISPDMYYLLIANMVNAVTKVSNTSGTYGAFLKDDDPRKVLPIHLEESVFFDNEKENLCYCQDVFKIIEEIGGDILYLDPPYNNRQYPPYYHILETVALYDAPEIYGKTGRRPYSNMLSPFCMADKAEDSLFDLVNKAKFRHIYISYSTDGLINYQSLTNRLNNIGEVKCFFKPYRRYKSNSGESEMRQKKLKEIIIYVKKR